MTLLSLPDPDYAPFQTNNVWRDNAKIVMPQMKLDPFGKQSAFNICLFELSQFYNNVYKRFIIYEECLYILRLVERMFNISDNMTRP